MRLEDAGGPLFFPITPFDHSGAVRLELLRVHIESRLEHGPGAVFVAGAAGEFHTMSQAEVVAVCAAAVEVVGGRVPVLCGVGGPLGHAVACARGAAEAGADALLVLPPYLIDASPDGLLAYVEVLAAATDRPLVVYHRPGARFDVAAVRRLLGDARVAGFKDGLGDLGFVRDVLAERARANRVHDFAVLNGMPTAELADAAYRAVGVGVYSSAVFAASPSIAVAFCRAAESGDSGRCRALIDAFYTPFDRLRNSRPGHGFAFVKAAVRLHGLACGPVRPPLIDIDAAEQDAVRKLFERGETLVATWP